MCRTRDLRAAVLMKILDTCKEENVSKIMWTKKITSFIRPKIFPCSKASHMNSNHLKSIHHSVTDFRCCPEP